MRGETWDGCKTKVRVAFKDVIGVPDAEDDSAVQIKRAHKLGKRQKGAEQRCYC